MIGKWKHLEGEEEREYGNRKIDRNRNTLRKQEVRKSERENNDGRRERYVEGVKKAECMKEK